MATPIVTPPHKKKHFSWVTTVLATALLAACGGESTLPVGGGGSPSSTTTLSGTAATGAAIVGANISVKCKSGSYASASPTTSNGNFSVASIPTSAFPCVVRSSGGISNGAAAPTLHSFVSSTSTATTTANITPLTDIITALALKQGANLADLSTWFSSAAGSAALEQVASSLSAAQTSLLTALAAQGFSTTGVTPFNGSITPAIPPATNADPYDNLLEALQAALAAASSSYSAMLGNLVAACSSASCSSTNLSSSLPVPTDDPTDPTDPTDPVDPSTELLNGKNGIAFVYGSHTWKIGRDVQVARYSYPTNSGFRNLSAKNTTPSGATADTTTFEGGTVSMAELNLDPAITSGITTCGANTNTWFKITVPVQGGYTDDDRLWIATSCSLQIDYMSVRGGMGGRILSATLHNVAKNKNITIAGGQFRVYKQTGTTGTAASPLTGDTYTSLNITGGTSFELPSGQNFLLNRQGVTGMGSSFSAGGRVYDGTPFFTGNAEDNIVWSVQNSAFSTTPNTTYNCNTRYTGQPTNYMQMYIRMGTYLNQHTYSSLTANGGSCAITVTQKSGSLVTGTYTATLVSTDDSTNKIVISGDFRTFANAPINTSNNGDEGALGNTDAGVDISIVDGNSLFTAGQRFRWPKSESYTDNTSGLEFAYDLKNEVIGGSYTDTEDLRHWDKGFNLNLRYLPKALGSYACGTAYDVNTGSVAVSNGIYPQAYLYTEQSIRFTAVKYQNSTYVLKTGTSCTINITKLDSDVIEGTYTAVMSDEDAAAVLPDGDGKISISGSFRHKITP